MALLGGAATAAEADGPVGKIRVCRVAHIVELMDRRSVPIPEGTGFVSGDDPKTGDQLKPYFRARTIEAATLPPKPGCVTIRARLDEAPAAFSLTPKYGPLPSQLNVAGLTVQGRVVEAFK